MMTPVEIADVEGAVGWPVVVKPSKQGSTVGLTVVRKSEDLAAAIEVAQEIDDEIMVEKFIAGREFTVGVLDGRALPVGEIFAPSEVFETNPNTKWAVLARCFRRTCLWKSPRYCRNMPFEPTEC